MKCPLIKILEVTKMRKSKKLVVGIILTALLLSAFIPFRESYAAFLDSITGAKCKVMLSVSNKTAVCDGLVYGTDKTTSISGTMRLYKTEGSLDKSVKSWNVSGKNRITASFTHKVSNGDYKLVLSVTVTNGKKSETFTRTATAKC